MISSQPIEGQQRERDKTMLTEEQASEKWCPAVRSSAGAYAKAVSATNKDAVCMGSRCMWWRWDVKDYGPGIEMPKMGYCGMAGKPW